MKTQNSTEQEKLNKILKLIDDKTKEWQQLSAGVQFALGNDAEKILSQCIIELETVLDRAEVIAKKRAAIAPKRQYL